MNDQVYEVYIRNEDGDTHHVDTLRDGLTEFLDLDNGYRISINIEGIVITLRRDSTAENMHLLDEHVGNQLSLDCAVTIRGMMP